MSEEERKQGQDAVEQQDPTGPEDSSDNPAEDPPPDEEPHAPTAPRTTFVASQANRDEIGRLTLHFASRDVDVLADGDAAMRIMAAHRRRRHHGLGDILDPTFSSAGTAWITLDPDEPLAISWLPGLPGKRPRMAIDPAA